MNILNTSIYIQGPEPGARVVYIDGAFDLFHAGHVEVHPFKCFKLINYIMFNMG